MKKKRDQEEERALEWQEHWFICGRVSKAAKEAIESVNGRVERLILHHSTMPLLYGVCLLWHPDDEEQGFSQFTDEGEKARKIQISSPDIHHDLYIYCEDGSIPDFFASDAGQLRLVTEAEWFAIEDNG